jgi:hypothetical protein
MRQSGGRRKMNRRITKDGPKLPEMKKGTLLVLKVAPLYTKSYLYEVTSAGDKLIRATLYHSPTVKKQWSREELLAMFNAEVARLANDDDVKSLTNPS